MATTLFDALRGLVASNATAVPAADAATPAGPGYEVERDGSNPGPAFPPDDPNSLGQGEPPIALPTPEELGPNNERLEDLAPRIVNALRGLVLQYREEGLVARRHEIRRIRQARLFWQGLQYAWWNPNDMQWHLPFESRIYDDQAYEEMPRYQFVTNLYQAFGLSFISVLSQDVPATRFFPQSAQSLVDISAARAASEVATLVEQNNHAERMLTNLAFFLWTDGKVGGYVRYVADGPRFGWHDEPNIEPVEIALGPEFYVCPQCGSETPAQISASAADPGAAIENGVIQNEPGPAGGALARRSLGEGGKNLAVTPNGQGAAKKAGARGASPAPPVCSNCGAPLTPDDLRPAERVTVPRITGVNRVPNGQEVISIIGGLELNTPVWANEMHEFPYLQWQMEVHRAKLKAAYPHAADKIEIGGPIEADDVYARASRVSISQGMPTTHPGDALVNLITFSRSWIRPWAFHAVEEKPVREALLKLFPEGCYAAFAGETYCESRNETMDDHWRVLHALPGDGQNRPAVGSSLVEIQERYNTLSNIQAETYEYGIPPIYADPQVLDFDALQQQTAEPAAHYPARARPGQPLAASFFQPAPAQVPPDMQRHQAELMGPISQFLTGLFPAVFGGEMESQKTATGYAMARDQALGRLGLIWRRLKLFYADVMLLGVDCFRKNRPDDVEIPLLGEDGVFRSRWIRLADLKGNIFAHPESDESFPRLKSQQRAVLQQLMTIPDPLIQRALTDPANIGYVKSVLGLSELVVPGEDARTKQMREIQQLLVGVPIVIPVTASAKASVIARSDGEAGAMRNPSASDTTAQSEAALAGDSAQQANPNEESRDSQPSASQEASAPDNFPAPLPGAGGEIVLPSIPVDDLLDDHATELEEIRRWSSTETGQAARIENPLGFANVRAHAAAHQRAMMAQQQAAALTAAAARVAPRAR
ncbi:MAG: hypothetical protein ACLP1Y_12050 [Candidatus Acidiferrales bacterium]